MSQRKKPPRLQPGMTVGIVAPSGPVLERSVVERGVVGLKSLGLHAVFGKHVYDSYGYLAGQDADRAEDLLAMLERTDIDAVMCLTGGYGANRTARALDPNRLDSLRAQAPVTFIGYSDITVIHSVLGQHLEWITFYGPNLTSFGRPLTEYTLTAFRRALFEVAPFDIFPDPDDPYLRTLVPGEAEGELVGGCLSLLVTLVGTPWEIPFDGKILCFEEVNEDPYRIDRMLSHLLGAGRLQRCAGIVVGEHAGCGPSRPGPTLGLEQVFDDLIRPLGIPTLYHLPIGHGLHLATLPLGARARLDASNQTLTFLEPSVS